MTDLTSAQLKAEIDQNHPGPPSVAAAPLGTCDEAGDAPQTPQRIKLAQQNAAPSERIPTDFEGSRSWLMPGFYGVMILIGVILIVLVALH